ncbi:MAG: hypothetical protein LBI05_01190 [Planctomycetaceae bacterium]|jgi:hypothetical protein|nr:hypothetical protein [Planctomycetaceae bacterium]
MRTTTIFDLDSAPTIHLQVYRTDEALFIYRPSLAGTALKRYLRPALKASLWIFLIMAVGYVLVRVPGVGDQPDDIIMFLFYPSSPLFFLGISTLIHSTKYLIRIDSTHIVVMEWTCGMGSLKKIARPERLELSRAPDGNLLLCKGQSRFTGLPARNYEIAWLRKVLDEFEANEKHRRGNLDDRLFTSAERNHPALSGTPPQEGNSPHSPPVEGVGGGFWGVWKSNPTSPKESSKSIRSVLQTMEYHGQPLERVWHPYELREQRAAEQPEYVPAVGLYVRCPACNAALPRENVWFEEAAGQCPDCRLVFQIDDLKDRTPPKRCRLQFWEDATGLHLHQKPRHGNLMTINLVGMALYGIVVYVIISMIVGCWLPIPLTLEFLQIASGFLLFTVFLVVFTIWTYHVHRYIDFGVETVRFRTRWLFWERSWSVARCEVGTFRGNLMTEFFGGVVLPYSANHPFYILATLAEREYLNSMVNRWRWRNPPEHLAGTPLT